MTPAASRRSTRRLTAGVESPTSRPRSANDRRPSFRNNARSLRSRSSTRNDVAIAVHFTCPPLCASIAKVSMFEEAQLYAPVTEGPDGVQVHLADDHPGAKDPE